MNLQIRPPQALLAHSEGLEKVSDMIGLRG